MEEMGTGMGATSSADSDDSTKRSPDDEERALLEDLLEYSSTFLRLYEEHQPELQQIIQDLEKSFDEFLNRYYKAIKLNTNVSLFFMATGLVGILVALNVGISLPMEIPLFITSVWASVYVCFTIIKQQKKISEDTKQGLENFKATSAEVLSLLSNICSHVEKILQYQTEQSSLMRDQTEDLREITAAELFEPDDLQRLVEQLKRTLDRKESISPLLSALRCMLSSSFLFGLRNYRMHKDLALLKKQQTIQENEVVSKAGRFIWKLRAMINHLWSILQDLLGVKSELERVIIPTLTEYFSQQRETKHGAETFIIFV